MTLRQLYYFQVLSQMKHYTKAAEILFISQPSLSYTIAELEKEFPAPLFEKSGKKVSLSPCGKIFLEYVNQALESLELGKNAVQQYVNSQNNTINIGYLHTIPSPLIDTILDTFHKEQDCHQLSFHYTISNNNSEILKALLTEKINFAFCLEISDGIRGVPLFHQDLYIIVSKDHHLAQKTEIQLDEIQMEPFVKIGNAFTINAALDQVFQLYHTTPNTVFDAGNIGVAITYILRGSCFTLAPILPTMDFTKLSALTIKGHTLSRPVYIAWKDDCMLTDAEERFREFIFSHFSVKAT